MLILHICAGTIGCLSGFIAVFLRKGSRQHGTVGKVFVFSMLTLAVSGTFLALRKFQITNVLGGVMTFYLVSTAWVTVRRKAARLGAFDWPALLFALVVGGTQLTFGTQAALSSTGLKYGYPPGIYFVMGSVVLLAAIGDIRMLVRGGVSGTPRIARHLWRMCFALFIASSSIFLARPQLFPAIFQKTGVLAILSFLPLVLMIFWLIRIRITKAYKEKMTSRSILKSVPDLRKPEYEPS
jgi:uncharacterized membrane protein